METSVRSIGKPLLHTHPHTHIPSVNFLLSALSFLTSLEPADSPGIRMRDFYIEYRSQVLEPWLTYSVLHSSHCCCCCRRCRCYYYYYLVSSLLLFSCSVLKKNNCGAARKLSTRGLFPSCYAITS